MKMLGARVPTLKVGMRTVSSDSWRSTGAGSTERGYDYRWQMARLEHLKAHPLCVKCEAQDVVELATVVDHKIPHRGDMDLFWNRNNWQSLCASHHSGDKQREEAAALAAIR